MKKFRALALGLAFTFVLGAGAACSRSGDSESAPAETTGTETQAAADASAGSEYAGRTVKIGLTGTIYEKIWEPIIEDFAQEGVTIELVQFGDFSLPNESLNAGEIDLNAFQHHAYFNSDVESNGYDITPIGDTFVIAMNLYSDKIESLAELKDGDTIAIPNDASNGGRAIKLLESAGVVTLKADAGSNPSVTDIESKTPDIEIKEVNAADISALLPDVTAAVINGNYALDYGIDPETAIYEETEYDDDSYFCLIAARSDEADDGLYKEIVERFQSEATKQIFEEEFDGYFVSAWDK